MRQSNTTIYVLLISSMILWGGTWVAGRVLAQSISPMSAAFLRYIFASGFLFILCRYERGEFPRLEREHVLPTIFLGATGVFAYSYFFFTGLQTVPASRAALIVACIPVCMAAVSALFFNERFGLMRTIGTLTSLVGVSIVVADGNPLKLLAGGVNKGDLFILGCVASWTAYSLGGKLVMKKLDALTAVCWSCFFGMFLLMPAALASGLMQDVYACRPVDWFCVVFLGVLATGFAYYWYYKGILAIGASRAGVFINLVPVFAIILAFFLLGENIHLSLLVGGVTVVGGVYLTNRP